MAKARRIYKRKKTVQNIRAFTKTMELVATSRFKKVHARVAAARPYTDRLSRLVGDIIARSRPGRMHHALLAEPPEGLKSDVLLLLTSDRGLCGSYNFSVLRIGMERMRQLEGAG